MVFNMAIVLYHNSTYELQVAEGFVNINDT